MNLPPERRINETKMQAMIDDPVNQLLQVMTGAEAGVLVDPKRVERALEWISSVPEDHPDYRDPLKWRIDLLHLGLMTPEGKLDRPVAERARDWLKSRWDEPPDNMMLWRHLRGRPAASNDYSDYAEVVATLLDKETPIEDIAAAVVAMADDGVPTPDQVLFAMERVQTLFRHTSSARHDELRSSLRLERLNWFPFDAVGSALRRILKDNRYDLTDDALATFLADGDAPGLIQQLKGFFGSRDKRQTLRDIGLIDEEGRWSEIRFLDMQRLTEAARTAGLDPSLERLRWDLHQTQFPDEPVAFAWALMNDFLPEPVLYRARRLANIALSGGMLGEKISIGETITSEQFEHLHRLGAWIHDPLTYRNGPALRWLGRLAAQKDINWGNWTQICSFVVDKLDQEPDRELLKDWQAGIVTFEGHGRYQEQNRQPFSGARKVGRNDPCPCGSDKKHKKCCGR